MNSLIWLLGRGASVACGLDWIVPQTWLVANRTDLEARVKSALRVEMDRPTINRRPYRLLLRDLARRTVRGWQHRFLTTNWDTLLQWEITALGFGQGSEWMPETHIFHLNGAVEDLPESDGVPRRSPFLLETDTAGHRHPALSSTARSISSSGARLSSSWGCPSVAPPITRYLPYSIRWRMIFLSASLGGWSSIETTRTRPRWWLRESKPRSQGRGHVCRGGLRGLDRGRHASTRCR